MIYTSARRDPPDRAFLFREVEMTEIALDVSGFVSALKVMAERDLRIAATWALNDTAKEASDHIRDRMTVVFDRPTTFTENAFYVKKARVDDLTAAVMERPTRASRDYLKVEEAGGPRRQTGFEGQMQRALAYDGLISAVIPADEARLDAYGNWSVGERNQVMSALKIQRDYAANATARSTLSGRKRKRSTYFVPQSGLYPGIYRKDASGNIGIVAILTDKVPRYAPRLGFHAEAMAVFEARLQGHLSRTLSQMFYKRLG